MKSNKYILRYLVIIILSSFLLVVLNYGLIAFMTRYGSSYDDPERIVSNLADEYSNNELISEGSLYKLKYNNLWVQVIDEGGNVKFEYNTPSDLKNKYSLIDIAVSSKGYVDDYPVFFWKSNNNLIILGYPKNSIDKYNFNISVNNVAGIPKTYTIIILFNLFIILLLSLVLVKILNKPTKDLIYGIHSLSKEKNIIIEEKGFYEEIAKSINKTSKIIEEKNNDIKLRESAIENWIASITHDVRTPLSMILGYSSMIENDESLGEEIKSEGKIISKNALRIKELVANLNLATYLKYNMQPLSLSKVKISTLIRTIIVNAINSGIIKKENCSVEVDDEEIMVDVDKELIERAIINILNNSVNHNKSECNVFIKVYNDEKCNDYCVITISNDGECMEEEKLKLINDTDYVKNNEIKDHGLGLEIVKNIISAHNGEFFMENREHSGVTTIIKVPKSNL